MKLGRWDPRGAPRWVHVALGWILAVGVVAVAVWVILAVLPDRVVHDSRFVARKKDNPAAIEEKRLKARNDARTAGAQVFAVIAVLVGASLTVRSLRLTREGQITDRYGKAIEQLATKEGTDSEATQLGAIYSLERIARDSRRDHSRIMELLLDQVRRGTLPVKSPGRAGGDPTSPSATVQAVADVLSRRAAWREGRSGVVDLVGRDLRNVRLTGAPLADANLSASDLSGGYFERCDLRRAHLIGTGLRAAHLENADVRNVDLTMADFGGAWVAGADFTGANFSQTTFKGARNLDKAIGLPDWPEVREARARAARMAGGRDRS